MRIALIAIGAAAAILLFLVLRPNDDAESRTERFGVQTVATTDTTPTQTDATTTEAVAPRRVGLNARIVVREGRVRGGLQRLRVQRGGEVVLVVEADVRDHVHVHGYDRMADVGPGRRARVRFRATLPGRFEVELEESGLQIAELEVRP